MSRIIAKPVTAGVLLGAALLVGGCADASLTRSGLLSSYEGQTRSDGVLTHASFKVDRQSVLAARTVAIMPAHFSDGAQVSNGAQVAAFSPEQRRLVSNSIDRSLCAGLSERFRIVSSPGEADLVVQAHVTAITPNNATIAGISSAARIGGSIAGVATGLPITVPRIPIGLGSLAVEAEAKSQGARQAAALTWARGADAITTRPRASGEADAYALASEFGADFARLLVTGDDPIKLSFSALPGVRGVGEFLGAAPREPVCARYGRNPGVGDLVGGMVGVPPNWTDSGAARP
jgi:hypothetical protein